MVDSEEASVVAGEDFTVVARGGWADPGDTKHSLGYNAYIHHSSVIKVFSMYCYLQFMTCKN